MEEKKSTRKKKVADEVVKHDNSATKHDVTPAAHPVQLRPKRYL